MSLYSFFNRKARLKKFTKIGIVSTILFFVAVISGCAIPDVRPFADATTTLSASVRAGGDMLITPLSEKPIWVEKKKKYIQPKDPEHPGKTLEADWKLRREAMDAIVIYSNSLVAIGEASANRQESAEGVVNEVKKLASLIPNIGTTINAAGDLVVFGLKTYIEIKAYHDMARAVKSADQAIKLVAKVIKEDFKKLKTAHASILTAKLTKSKKDIRIPQRNYEQYKKEQKDLRNKILENLDDQKLRDKMIETDALLAGVEPEYTSLQNQIASLEQEKSNGKNFFNKTIEAINAWAEAHAKLSEAFEKNQSPNLVLLAARAQELKIIIEEAKFKEIIEKVK
jgi:hypothetical protein